MNKEKILQKSEDFSDIISNGKKLKNKYFSLYYNESAKTHFGITVPKKIGHAVIRNRLKRQIKNIISQNEMTIQQQYNYVIIVKETSLTLDYEGLKINLLELLRKVGI